MKDFSLLGLQDSCRKAHMKRSIRDLKCLFRMKVSVDTVKIMNCK